MAIKWKRNIDFKKIISGLKDTIKRIKEGSTENILGPYEKARRRYPQLKILSNEDALKIEAQLDSTRWQKVYSIFFVILTLVTIFTAIYFNVVPQPYKPDIHLSTNYEGSEVPFSEKFSSVDFLLYIYNQGSGACIDMRLDHTSFFQPSLRPQKTFRQYTDMKDEIKDNFNSSTFISADDIWRMGTLSENEVIVVDITRRHDRLQMPEEMTITVTCSNKETESITIKNKYPFVVENPLP